MTHKCNGCRHKGEHREMMFRPFGVCTRETNLIEAEKAYNAEKCPYKQTNADRIRAMSDEELADFFADKCLMATYSHLTDAKHNRTATQIAAEKHTAFCILLKWLKQPAEVKDDA